jgi:hypothetical protein
MRSHSLFDDLKAGKVEVLDWNHAMTLGVFDFKSIPRMGEWIDGQLIDGEEEMSKYCYKVIQVEHGHSSYTDAPDVTIWVIRKSRAEYCLETEMLINDRLWTN